MSLSHYYLSKNIVTNKNTEFQPLNEALDCPYDQENLCLYSWIASNMITLLAGLLVKSEGTVDSVVYHRVMTGPHPGQSEHMCKHAYSEKSPGNGDRVGLHNVL